MVKYRCLSEQSRKWKACEDVLSCGKSENFKTNLQIRVIFFLYLLANKLVECYAILFHVFFLFFLIFLVSLSFFYGCGCVIQVHLPWKDLVWGKFAPERNWFSMYSIICHWNRQPKTFGISWADFQLAVITWSFLRNKCSCRKYGKVKETINAKSNFV